MPFKAKNVGVKTTTYRGITSEEVVGWAFSPTKTKLAFTLAEGATHVDKFGNYRKTAFTLAEVLITLGIIGIVAALTLPTLIQNHANKVVETRLMKFYSAINQAITLAEVDYGDRTYWYAKYDDLEKDAQGRPVTGKSDREKWVNKYLAPYMKITETKYTSGGTPVFHFADGGAFAYTHETSINDWMFYTQEYTKCLGSKRVVDVLGICAFRFHYNPVSDNPGWANAGRRTFEPYKFAWDGTLEGLINGNSEYKCTKDNGHYCTAYIQYNGWKIPEDYPFKVRY